MKKRTRDLNLKPGSLTSLGDYHPSDKVNLFFWIGNLMIADKFTKV
jgi:hypothetical protein